LLVPLLVPELEDRVVTRSQWSLLPRFAISLLVVLGVQAGLALFNNMVIERIGQGVVRDLRHLPTKSLNDWIWLIMTRPKAAESSPG
jgi:hypothetical protein